MATVHQCCETIDVSLSTGPDLIDITDKLSACVSRCHIIDGTVSAFMVGSTGSITTIEYEPGVVADLKQAISRLVPTDLPYAHEPTPTNWPGMTATATAMSRPPC
jgi:thiamine phosphate synthase YjbQ (UPF0047 family)